MMRQVLIAFAALSLLNGTLGPSLAQTPPGAEASAGTSFGPFAYLPYTDPAYRNLGLVQDAGLVNGFGYELGRARIAVRETDGTYSSSGYLTTYQIAAALINVYPSPASVASDAQRKLADAVTRRRTEEILARQPPVLEAFRALVNECRPVLEKLGQDVPAVQAHFTALAAGSPSAPTATARPFPDVPKNHWASSSVETVRQFGLLLGYPNGAFETGDGHD